MEALTVPGQSICETNTLGKWKPFFIPGNYQHDIFV
jgi:hypothetical protein